MSTPHFSDPAGKTCLKYTRRALQVLRPLRTLRTLGSVGGLCLLGLTSALTPTSARAENPLKNALYLDIVAYGVSIAGVEMPEIGAQYERVFSSLRVGLLTALRGGYVCNEDNCRYALSGGLGLRKYLLDAGSGPFLQAVVDGGGSRNLRETDADQTQYLLASIEYGFKVQWPGFLASVHAGPAFYGFERDKSTSLIVGIDLGFPFSLETFRLP